jgi:hypothetical protein
MARLTYPATTPECCPRCGRSSGVLALLTSFAAYYVCGQCAHRWQIAAGRAEGRAGPSI